MLIVYDKVNEKIISNMGTNSAFPDGNLPELPELPEGQIYLRCNDNSDEAKALFNAEECSIVYDENNVITAVTVLKEVSKPVSIEDRLSELEYAIADILGGGGDA